MSNTTVEEIDALVTVYFRVTPSARKYQSPANDKEIVARVRSYGVTPSDTGVMRAIQELSSEGRIARADGGNATTDAAVARAAEQARTERLASAPLTSQDFENFSGLAPAEVERRFYSDKVFAARYRTASAKWGFLLPGRPAAARQDDVPAEADTSEWRNLDAATYSRMPATQIVRLYRSDAGYKRAVDRLIKAGAI